MLSSVSSDFDQNPLNIHYSLIDVVSNTELGVFDSLSGGDVETKTLKFNTVYSTGEHRTILVPGPTQYSPVVLERGLGRTKDLYNWFVLANNGNLSSARKNVTIKYNAFISGVYTSLVEWNLINAWPSKIAGFSGTQEGSPRTARFSITLVAEKIQRVDPTQSSS
jgi:phage tail-like protein